MNFQRGFREAVTGIIAAIIINALLAGFAEEGLIPSYLVILFTIVGFFGSGRVVHVSHSRGFYLYVRLDSRCVDS